MFLEKILKIFGLKPIEQAKKSSALYFPKYEDLSYEQKEAVNMPINKNNVVLGAPGTGKTIVAIHRVHKIYVESGKKALMLVFNRSLYKYIVEVQKVLNMENEFNVQTINDFAYFTLYNGKKDGKETNLIDKDPPHVGDNKYHTDWEQVLKDISGVEKRFDYIVIDEGQDFNEYFYEVIKVLTKNITIFADPNQAIQKDSASLSKMLEIIGKESYFVLTLNYRNSRNVVDFTRRYCYDKSIFAESYVDKDDLEVLPFDEDTYVDTILGIIKKCGCNTNIGVIVPSVKNSNGDTDRKYEYGVYDRLREKLSNDYIVSLYYNENTNTDDELKKKRNVDFGINSIKIFNYATVRGLDFDVVILIDNLSIELEDTIYIASTRAKEKLYILKKDIMEVAHIEDAAITYSYFDNIVGFDLNKCLSLAREAEEKEFLVEALYYYHYAIAVIGIDDKNILKRAICSFANLCINYNKADFALGIIFNYSYKYNENNDKDLILFYQSALIHSYNSNFVFNNLDKFFNRISVLSEDDIDDLLSEMFSKYLAKCIYEEQTPDLSFASEQIMRFNYNHLPAYVNFVEKCKEYNVDSEKEENFDEDDGSQPQNDELNKQIENMTGHELLCGSYIKVIAASNKYGEGDFLRKGSAYGFEKNDFDFNLDYKKMTNLLFSDIKLNSDKPVAIIYGATPHKTKNMGDYSSLLERLKQPGYPKTFETSHSGDLSLSMFKKILEEIIVYLKGRFYRKMRLAY